MTERFPCKTPGCQGRIVADTVAKTGGYCLPCVHESARRQREREIARNRVDIDRFDGVTDPVAIVELMHAKREHDPSKNFLPYPRSKADVVMSMDEADIARLVHRLKSRLADDSIQDENNLNEVASMATALACLTRAELAPVQLGLLHAKSPYPGVIYRDANKEVVEHLVRAVEQGDSVLRRDHALTALAWTGSPRVERLFASWVAHPPDWAEQLQVPPQDYSFEAGWSLDDTGAVAHLWKSQCFSLVKRPSNVLAIAFADSGRSCPQCSRPLVVLLDLDLRRPELSFLSAHLPRLPIPACLACSCYGVMFFRIAPDGTWAPHPSSPKPEWLPGPEVEFDVPAPALALGGARPALATADWCLEAVSGSQVGGAPCWVQDADYPRCPDCRRDMSFVGQVAMEDVEAFGDGIYYGFCCESCGVAASSFQQS